MRVGFNWETDLFCCLWNNDTNKYLCFKHAIEYAMNDGHNITMEMSSEDRKCEVCNPSTDDAGDDDKFIAQLTEQQGVKVEITPAVPAIVVKTTSIGEPEALFDDLEMEVLNPDITMTEANITKFGFNNQDDLHALVSLFDLHMPGAMDQFRKWQSEDGTKSTLLKLIKVQNRKKLVRT